MKFLRYQGCLSEEVQILVEVTYLADSLFIYVGDRNLQMNNAYLTIQTNYVNYDNPLYC